MGSKIYVYNFPQEIFDEICSHFPFEKNVLLNPYVAKIQFIKGTHTWKWATKNGYLHVCKWLYKNKCGKFKLKPIANIAVMYGQLDILKFFKKIKKIKCNAYTLELAIENEQFETAKWICIIENIKPNEKNINTAARNNCTEMVQFLISRSNVNYYRNLMEIIIERNNMELVEWLIDNKINCNMENIVNMAAGCGNLDLMKYFLECGYSYNTKRVKTKHLHIVKYLCENNIYTDFDVDNAISSRYFDVAEYLIKERKAIPHANYIDTLIIANQNDLVKYVYHEYELNDIANFITKAIHSNNIEIALYLCDECRYRINIPNAIIEAAKYGRYEIATELFEICTDEHKKISMIYMAEYDYLGILQYIQKMHGSKYYTPHVMYTAAKSGHPRTIRHLCKYYGNITSEKDLLMSIQCASASGFWGVAGILKENLRYRGIEVKTL